MTLKATSSVNTLGSGSSYCKEELGLLGVWWQSVWESFFLAWGLGFRALVLDQGLGFRLLGTLVYKQI